VSDLKSIRTVEELDAMTDLEIRQQVNLAIQGTHIGSPLAQVYLDELRNRAQSRIAASVEKLTRKVFWLTVVLTLLTFMVTVARRW
jgi:hypothetical protein